MIALFLRATYTCINISERFINFQRPDAMTTDMVFYVYQFQNMGILQTSEIN